MGSAGLWSFKVSGFCGLMRRMGFMEFGVEGPEGDRFGI